MLAQARADMTPEQVDRLAELVIAVADGCCVEVRI